MSTVTTQRRDCTKPGSVKPFDEPRIGDVCRSQSGEIYRVIALAEGFAMCKRPGVATPFVTTLTIVYHDQQRFGVKK